MHEIEKNDPFKKFADKYMIDINSLAANKEYQEWLKSLISKVLIEPQFTDPDGEKTKQLLEAYHKTDAAAKMRLEIAKKHGVGYSVKESSRDFFKSIRLFFKAIFRIR